MMVLDVCYDPSAKSARHRFLVLGCGVFRREDVPHDATAIAHVSSWDEQVSTMGATPRIPIIEVIQCSTYNGIGFPEMLMQGS